jgi:hypothetical protein
MKVYFACSTKDIERHARDYRAARDEIVNLGHNISRDWIDYSINVASKNIEDIPSHKLYKDIMTAILTSDAVIFDITVRSMSVGHQITQALNAGKPVLVIRRKKKKESLKKLFLEGSDYKDLQVSEYKNADEIQKLIKQFLNKYDKKTQKRFNLVMSGAQENYISWASFNYKKTKTDIIHESIDRMIEKDPVYKKYLERQS